MAAFDLPSWERRFETFLAGQPSPDGAHGIGHIRRVVVQAKRLGQAEGADLRIVVPAAWLHDCVAVAKDDPGRSEASRRSALVATAWLGEEGYPSGLVPAIGHAIEAHSYSAGIRPQTVEAAVVQDADRLDALGAVGIARTFMVGGAMGSQIAHDTEPFPISRRPDDRRYAVDHFYAKLLGLADTMQTAAGRAEAHRRTAFIRAFLGQLGDELGVPAPDGE